MAGETDDTDLAERERQAAEDRAFELNPHGTGVDPDINLNYDYDYEASPELTDADYQPNNSFSDDFTNYAGADPYASQFGQDENDEAENESNADDRKDDEDEVEDIEDWDSDDEDEADKEDEENEDGDEENDQDANDEANDDAENKPKKPMTKEQKKAAKKEKKAAQKRKQEENRLRSDYYQDIKIKWKKGDPVDLPTLSTVWGQCRKINQVRPLMDDVNRALDAVLLESGSGPNLMIKFNKYIHSVMNQDDDMMGSLLQLANSGGKRMALTVGSVFEAIFVDQQWLQPVLLGPLPTTLSGIIATQPLQMLLQKLFEIAVPIINDMAKDQAKSAKVVLPQ